MLTSLIELLSAGLGQAMSWFMSIFLNAMDLSMDSYLEFFPFFRTAYNLLKGFSWGLLFIIAGTGLALFFFGAFDGGAIQERPISVLVRTFFAGCGIMWGGYVLVFLVNLAVIPFDAFLNADSAIQGGWNVDLTLFSTELAAAATGQTWILMGDLAIALMDFFLMLLIAWNLFKLIIEVAERYLMVGVLVFTAPIVYPTLATKNTSGIFKRWVSMFAGSLIIMSLSALFLKLIVSGFTLGEDGVSGSFGESAHFLFKLVLILAMCKIAQRVDSYMQQLGIGVATTGGSMLDDALMAFRTIQSAFGGRGGAIGPDGLPMGGGGGARGGMGKLGDFYRATSPFAAGRKAAADAYKSGQGVWGSIKTGAAAVGNKMKSDFTNHGVIGKTAQAVKKAKESGQPLGGLGTAKAAGKALGSTVANQAIAMANPRAFAEHDAAQKVDAEANRAAYEQRKAETAAPGNAELPDAKRSDAEAGRTKPQDFAGNFSEFGVQDKATGSAFREENGEPSLTAEAMAAGATMDAITDQDGAPSLVVGGNRTAANHVIAEGYSAVGRQRITDSTSADAHSAPMNDRAQSAYAVMQANQSMQHAQQQLQHTDALIQNYKDNGQAVPEHLMETRQQQQAAFVDSSNAYHESMRAAGVSNIREAHSLFDSEYHADLGAAAAVAEQRVPEWKAQDQQLVDGSRSEIARLQSAVQVAQHDVNDARTPEQQYTAMQQLHSAREALYGYQDQVSEAKDRLSSGYYDRPAQNVYEERAIVQKQEAANNELVDRMMNASVRNSSVYDCGEQLRIAHQYTGTDKVFFEQDGPAVLAAQQVFGSAAPVIDQRWADHPQAMQDTTVSAIRIESPPPVEIDGAVIQQGTRYTVSYSNPILSSQPVEREFLDPVAYSALTPAQQSAYIDYTDGAGRLWKTLPDILGGAPIDAPREGQQAPRQPGQIRTNYGNRNKKNKEQ